MIMTCKCCCKSVRGKLPYLMREALAEFASTFILIIFGCGSVAQAVLSKQNNGTFFSINFSWGMGVTMGCYWAAGVSGAHMNPAVTLAFAVVRRFKWKKVPVYIFAQMLGAFTASACLYGVYYDALNAFDGGKRQILGPQGTAGIWATYPQEFLSTWVGFADQVFGTAVLVSCICAITDASNAGPHRTIAPILVGFVVFVIGATFGFNCGYAINPARDLGPRLFTAVAGWGTEVFTVANYWSWVPCVACPIGGVLGAVLYIVLIELHHDAVPEGAEEVPDEDRNVTRIGYHDNTQAPVNHYHHGNSHDSWSPYGHGNTNAMQWNSNGSSSVRNWKERESAI